MSDPVNIQIPPGGSGFQSSKPLTPKQVAAHAQSRNSFTRILFLGGLLFLLCSCTIAAMIWRPEHVKDLLLIIGTTAGYMAGTSDFVRKEEG